MYLTSRFLLAITFLFTVVKQKWKESKDFWPGYEEITAKEAQVYFHVRFGNVRTVGAVI
jgi:hypothetical protein